MQMRKINLSSTNERRDLLRLIKTPYGIQEFDQSVSEMITALEAMKGGVTNPTDEVKKIVGLHRAALLIAKEQGDPKGISIAYSFLDLQNRVWPRQQNGEFWKEVGCDLLIFPESELEYVKAALVEFSDQSKQQVPSLATKELDLFEPWEEYFRNNLNFHGITKSELFFLRECIRENGTKGQVSDYASLFNLLLIHPRTSNILADNRDVVRMRIVCLSALSAVRELKLLLNTVSSTPPNPLNTYIIPLEEVSSLDEVQSIANFISQKSWIVARKENSVGYPRIALSQIPSIFVKDDNVARLESFERQKIFSSLPSQDFRSLLDSPQTPFSGIRGLFGKWRAWGKGRRTRNVNTLSTPSSGSQASLEAITKQYNTLPPVSESSREIAHRYESEEVKETEIFVVSR